MIPVRDYLALLSANLHGLGRRIAGLVVALVVAIGLQLVGPQLLRRIIDGAIAGDGRSTLVPIAATFIAIALVAQLVQVLATWLAEDVGWRATNRLRADLAAHVLGLDLSFHTTHAPGHLIERIDGDVTALSNFFSAMTVKVLGNGLLIAGVVVLVLRESLLLGGVLGLLIVGALLSFVRLHALVVPWWAAVSATNAEVFGQVGEQVGGTEDVVPNGAAGFMQERFADGLRRLLPQTVRGWTGYAMMWGSSQVLQIGSLIALVVIGTSLVGSGAMTVGAVFLVLYYLEMIIRPLHQLREQFQDLQKAGGAIARIEGLRAVATQLRQGDERSLPRGPLSLTVAGVSFAYPEEGEDAATVLAGVDVHVPAGRSLGVLGRTGAGKSTLAKLVVRLHDPDEGAVLLGGVPATDVAGLRDHVGMVTQDVQLFRASVRDNLTFFDGRVDDRGLVEVLADLGLGEWLAALPRGLDTVLDAGDVSAGQAQLLAFARIFLRDPGLVVLDEASSRLDPVTEAALERAVDRLLERRTAVIVAHRLHTLDRVDDVLVLEDGRVVEHGDRVTLAADPTSRFARLRAAGMEEVLA